MRERLYLTARDVRLTLRRRSGAYRIALSENPRTSPPEAPVAWSQSPLEEQTTSSGGALEGSTYGVLNGNIRIAVPKDWAAGEVGTIALEWAPEGGSQRLVAYVQTTYEETKDAPATVNLVKFEVQTGGPANGP